MASRGSTHHRHSRGPQTSTHPGAAVQTTDTSMSPCSSTDHDYQHGLRGGWGAGGSTDHGGLSRNLNPENKPFFISDVLSLLRAREILWLGRVCSRLLHTCQPYPQQFALSPTLQPSPIPATVMASLVLPLSTVYTLFLLLPTYPLYICSLKRHYKLQCVTQYLFFAPKPLHAVLVRLSGVGRDTMTTATLIKENI